MSEPGETPLCLPGVDWDDRWKPGDMPISGVGHTTRGIPVPWPGDWPKLWLVCPGLLLCEQTAAGYAAHGLECWEWTPAGDIVAALETVLGEPARRRGPDPGYLYGPETRACRSWSSRTARHAKVVTTARWWVSPLPGLPLKEIVGCAMEHAGLVTDGESVRPPDRFSPSVVFRGSPWIVAADGRSNRLIEPLREVIAWGRERIEAERAMHALADG